MPRKKGRQKSRKQQRPRGVRAFWSGVISFGLVNVPVYLFPANRQEGVSLRMLSKDGTPLSRRYYCPEDQRDVHPEHILRGYPLENDEYVIVRDDELEAIEPKKTREIDLRQFVKLSDISPMFFHRAYFLTPAGDTNKAYRLLAAVMEDKGRAGIATFVMRNREYLIAILAERGILRSQTLRFEDELRTPEDVGLPPAEKPHRDDVNALQKLIKEKQSEELDVEALRDEYAQEVKQLAERKAKKRKNVLRMKRAEPVDADESDESPGIDLLETIRRSLQQDGNEKSNGKSSDGRPANPSSDDLKSRSKDDLYERAKQLAIPGRSKLNKQQLIRAIARARKKS